MSRLLPTYAEFSNESSEKDGSEEGLLSHTTKGPTKPRSSWCPTGIQILAAAQTATIFILLFVIFLLQKKKQCQSYFPTDLTHLEGVVGFKEKSFTNPLQPTKNRSTWEFLVDEPEWVGLPRPEIDNAWEDLLKVTTFNRSGEAGKRLAQGKTYQYPDGNYVMGFEVYHGLHCIDTLRKFLWPDKYPLKDTPQVRELHKEHCIDYLRQYVQCNADLSPMWARWDDVYTVVIQPYTPHTCRDFDALHRWILDGEQ